MRFKIALLFLGFWWIGVIANIGQAAHVFLLVGLLVLLLAFLKSRDDAARRAPKTPVGKP